MYISEPNCLTSAARGHVGLLVRYGAQERLVARDDAVAEFRMAHDEEVVPQNAAQHALADFLRRHEQGWYR
ncbi:MAG: hypothetical protein WDM81_17680 [Rhizomicrobium sp.]